MNPSIIIEKANEGNLKNISLQIPRNKLICVTGVSGSGKSTLVMDTLYQECQRQYLEAIGLQGIQKPDVEQISNVSPAIQISQHHTNKNPRSTVGTLTNTYTDLRLVYEKIGLVHCKSCEKPFHQCDGKEMVEQEKGDFHVFVLCPHCEHKQSRLTRSNFSANTMEGACPTCSGIGEQVQIDWGKVVDVSLSLEDGAIVIFDKGYKQYMLSILYKAFAFYELADVKEKAVQAWTDDHRKILYEGVEQANINPEKGFPKNVTSGKFEGLAPFLWRRYQDKQGTEDKILDFFQTTTCSSCHGEKLNPVSRAVTVNKIRLPELSTYSLEQLYQWIMELKEELSDKQRAHVDVFLLDIATKLKRLLKVGVGYLTMNRQVITLIECLIDLVLDEYDYLSKAYFFYCIRNF